MRQKLSFRNSLNRDFASSNLFRDYVRLRRKIIREIRDSGSQDLQFKMFFQIHPFGASFYMNFWTIETHFFKKWANPGLFLFIFVLFKHTFHRNNCRHQRDSYSDSRNQHHETLKVNFSLRLNDIEMNYVTPGFDLTTT